MADNSVKFLTGSISDLQAKNTNGTPKVPIVPGRVYFAVDTDRNYGYIAYDVSASQRLVMSTRAELSDRVSHDLTLGDKSYNGSADVDILGSDLHRLSASNYLGITNTNITTSPGITTASVYIIAEKKNKTAVVGNLVIYNNKEYYWSGGAGWKPVGAASFKLRQNPILSPSASSSTISFIDTISQDENGIITATKKTVRNATASQSGVVTTTEQTFSGLKIFNNGIKLGSNINMGDAGTPSSYPFVGNKITWTGGTDGAEIYYRLDSSDAGRLFLNMTDDTNALIALAYNGTAKSYINPSTPSFYPATSNTGSLGTSSNKWANIYATTIHGNLDGNANTATNATTATNLSAAGTWTWANGTTAGPTATLVLGGKTTNIGAIPSASTSQSGIVTTGAQSFAGVKTFTNKIVLKDGNQAGAQIGAAYITTASATNGEVVLQNGHLRFGGSGWDYNQWAGLKYDHVNKKIVLGLADGSEFTANNAQSGGTFKLAGISTVDLNKTASIRNLAVGGGIYWNPYVESSSDGSDAASITVLSSGAAGGTELRIQQANDSTDIINLVSPYYIYFNSKQAFQINDSWLRINPNGGFSSGTLFSRLLRADAELQARDIGLYNANQFRTGRWHNVATGTAGDGSNSGTMGAVYLELGNGTAQSAASGAGGGNAKGYLRLYGSSTAVGTLEFDNTYFRPSADIYFVNNSSSTSGWANGIRGQVGANDYWRVGGGATGSNAGYMEIATSDDANEPIYVRQYSGVFGTLNTTLTLLDASHNTIIPNALTVGTTTSQAANYKFYVNGTSYFNGNTTHNGIDYFANGTTYYINNSADANLRRGIFSGTSNGDTAASSFFNTGALEIREAGRVGNGQTSFNYAPRIGFHWSGRIAGSLSFHNDGIFYFRKQNGTDRATIDANVNGNSSTATQFASNKSITLTGDVSGSASSKGGWSITTSIGAGKVTNAMLAGSIENGKLINSKITLAGNDVSLGGSLSADTLRTSLGLSNALHFIGIATVAITDGSTTDPKISGYTTKTSGDVIIDKDSAYEYIWTGSKWERLGGDGSYKVVQSAVTDPTASGTSNTFIATISQDANGKITATKKTVAVTNNAPTLAWGTTSTIGIVAGTSLQVKMPANPNVDTKVTQNAIKASDYTNWRPLIWGASNSSTEGFTPSTVTDGVYTAQTLSCQPSSGTIRATTFKGNLSGNANTATTATRLYGGSIPGWGTLTSANGYANISSYDYGNLGAYGIAGKGGQLSIQVDGFFYQNEGQFLVLDTNNYNNYAPTKTGGGASGTWGINITGNAATATKLATARTISLTGSVTGSGTFDGSGNLSIATTTNHTHKYAGSASAGGSANSAVKLDTATAGDSNTPVYFSGGKPVACTSLDLNTSGTAAGLSSVIANDKLPDRLREYHTNGMTLDSTACGWYYASSSNTSPFTTASDFMVMNQGYSTAWGSQIATDFRSNRLAVRNKNNGTWNSWVRVLDQNTGVARAHYGTTSGSEKYVLITINKETHWMLNFTIKLYQSYTATDIQVSGYNYGSNYWYSPNAVILGSTNTNGIKVYFGYTGAYKLWVAVDGGDYTGVDVLNAVNGYQQISLDDAFTITRVSALPGALQSTITAYRPYYRNETVTAATKLATARTIWGQLFDGTANISGNMTGVGNINTAASPAGTIYTSNWFRSTGKTGWYSETYGGGLYMTDSTYIRNFNGKSVRLDNLCLGADNNSYRLYVNGIQYIQSNSSSSTTKGLTINNGVLSISNYNQTLSVGAQNTSWTHFETTGSQFYFNKQIHIDGNLTRYNYSGSGYGTISGYNLAGNAASATKLATARNITIGNKTNSFNGSADIAYNLQDVLIRAGNEFNYTADGIAGLWFNYKTQTGTNSTTKITNYYFGNGQGGTGGVTINASNFSGNAATATNADTVDHVHLEWAGSQAASATTWLAGWTSDGTKIKAVRQSDLSVSTSSTLAINNTMGLSNCLQYIQTSSQTSANDLPSATWYHVLRFNHGNGDTYYKRLMAFSFWGRNNVYTATAEGNGTTSAWSKFWLQGDSVTGAVWNDYAEYREADTIQGGRCVREVGDDTLTLTTKRLMRGCSITSDTWGFAQGETDKAKTPIAVAGRVLAYPLEDRELFREYIGYSVCSGPNGTVSLMTEEEELKYPWAIVGTVSAVPDYEEWGGGEMADRPSVKVDGRVWIRIK